MAAVNSSVKYFLDQSEDAISVTTLSSLANALKEPKEAYAVFQMSPAARKSILQRLVHVVNSGQKNTAARIMALECLYWLSQVQDTSFRNTELFGTLQEMNQSFDQLLQQEAEMLVAQTEMLTVLLLRCTEYVRLKAVDILFQLCAGNEERLITLLLSIIKNRIYEWPLLQAAMRLLYELTIPATYFPAPEPGRPAETSSVTSFQTKITNFIRFSNANRILPMLLEELTARWQLSSSHQDFLGALGRPASVAAVTEVGPGPRRELLNWAVVLRYLSVMITNMADYASQGGLSKELQQSMMKITSSQPFLAGVLLPHVIASLHAWELTVTPDEAKKSTNGFNDPFLNSSIAALRLLRFCLYKPSESPSDQLQSALSILAQQTTRLEPRLHLGYGGMLILILVVECLCNLNAKELPSGAVNLSGSLNVLLSTIATDKSPLRSGAPCTTAQGFAICFSKEDSPYFVAKNASVDMVHAHFAAEEQEIKEDAEAFEAIERLEEQLDALQGLIMQLALGQMLAEMSMAGVLTMNPNGAMPAGLAVPPPPQALLAEHPSQAPASAKKAKAQHPAEYCCSMTGKLMREPVVLKNGHRFEFDVLQEVVDSVGHVDPLTGESFNEALDVDEALQQEIAQYRVKLGASQK